MRPNAAFEDCGREGRLFSVADGSIVGRLAGAAQRVEVAVDDEQAALGAGARQRRQSLDVDVVRAAVRRVAVPDEHAGGVVLDLLDLPRAVRLYSVS